MFDDEPDAEPHDGSQFDVVEKYGDVEPGDVGPPVPEAPDPTDPDVEVDGRVRTVFWSLVVVIKFALLATSLGVLMVVFDRYAGIGWQLLAAGLVLFVYAGYRYRRAQRELADLVDDGDPSPAEHEG